MNVEILSAKGYLLIITMLLVNTLLLQLGGHCHNVISIGHLISVWLEGGNSL